MTVPFDQSNLTSLIGQTVYRRGKPNEPFVVQNYNFPGMVLVNGLPITPEELYECWVFSDGSRVGV